MNKLVAHPKCPWVYAVPLPCARCWEVRWIERDTELYITLRANVPIRTCYEWYRHYEFGESIEERKSA